MAEVEGGRKSAWASLICGVLAAVPALLALAVFGVLQTPDSPGYIAYAGQMLHGIPSGAALLAEGPSPVTLFRTPGYPAVLALCEMLVPGAWRAATVGLQILAQALVAVATRRAALALGVPPGRALLAALLPALSFSVVLQIALLTDALYAAAATGAALALLRPGGRTALAAGVLLGIATLFREATPFIAFGYLPLAVLAGRPRLLRAAAVLLPPLAAAGGLMAWNMARIGQPLLTTSRQTVMVQAVLPLLAHGRPVYDGADSFDRLARATVVPGGYAAIDTFHDRLFREAGMTAPAIAATATDRYWSAWQRFPAAMLGASLGRFRHEFLALPFQPVDTVAALMVYAGWPRPVFDRLDRLWAALRGGSAMAGLWIVADIATRLVGTAIGALALLAPLIVRTRAAWGLWLVCAAFVGVYLPVHIETRYLAPVVPLACLLAAIAADRKERGSFLKKRTKKLLFVLGGPIPPENE